MEPRPGISADGLAVLALTSRLGVRSSAVPLSPRDWARVAGALATLGLRPAELLGRSEAEVGDLLRAPAAGAAIARLLARSSALGVALEPALGRGLWVLSVLDAAYPRRLRARLGDGAPPVLFGFGPQALLGEGGVAIVGSRDAGADDLAWAREAGASVAASGRPVVSGGARGVDSAAMDGAASAGGACVAVVADSLERAVRAPAVRSRIASERAVLCSPSGPDVPFGAGNALGRNRLIYCLADAAVVVRAGEGAGGTWAGAVECLKAGWVPVHARIGGMGAGGDDALVALGARRLAVGPEAAGRLPEPLAPAPATLFGD